MRSARALSILVVGFLICASSSASAESLGTFRWRTAPFCNVLKVTVTASGGVFTFDGFDERCGNNPRQPVDGIAVLQANGVVTLGLSVVSLPGGALPLNLEASIDTATLNGGWRDIAGNSGLTSGVELRLGGSAWLSVSDANLKEHFRDLDGDEVLAKISRMPIREWSYKAQDAAIRHVGPTAQDFHAAFGLGEDPLKISTIDADGVALRAIQALQARTRTQHERMLEDTQALADESGSLVQENAERKTEIATLKAELMALRAEIAALREVRR